MYFAIKDKTDKEIDYELLSQHYRYDVKLRRALHKTISFIEIAMRAAINNAYFNQHVQLSKDRWMSELSDLFGVEYKPEQIVKRAWKDLKKKNRDVSIHGATARGQALLVKILPHRIVMRVWMKQQKLQ